MVRFFLHFPDIGPDYREIWLISKLMGDSLVKRSEKICTICSGDFHFACFGNLRHYKMADGAIVLTFRTICQKSMKDPKHVNL